MATIPWVHYDDDTGGFASNCFPVRTLIQQAEEEGGAWKVAYNEEEKRRFKAILCSKPRTYSRIREERKKAEREGTRLTADNFIGDEAEETPILDGFFLMKHCCVEDPSDLCSVNIAGKELSEIKEDDLSLFDNVVYVNAGENYLPFEAFRGFPMIQELEIPLNGLRGIKLSPVDFPYLEVVDVSYNNLGQDDILSLGRLPQIKVLHLTGNGFSTLPQNMGHPFYDPVSQTQESRFGKLEVLMLDDNRLSDLSIFASLAGLSRLQHLSLEKNEIFYVPQLKSMEGKVVTNTDEKATRRLKKSADRSMRSLKKSVVKPEQSALQAEDSRKNKDFDDLQVNIRSSASLTISPDATKAPHNSATQSSVAAKNTNQAETEVNLADISEEATNLTSENLLNTDVNIPTLETEGTDLTETFSNRESAYLPPFPELRYLNLSHNKIVDEEALLAVAAWPLLVELIIHNNPLTTRNSGDPPLLKRFLHDRLGIKLMRKKETTEPKYNIEIQQRKSRMVTSVVPKIPKVPFDELLMLEAPHPPTEGKASRRSPHHNIRPAKPLPIMEADGETPQEEEPEAEQVPKIPLKEVHDGKRTKKRVSKPKDEEADAFFITQVGEPDKDKGDGTDDKRLIECSEKNLMEIEVADKYKGYEMLLDVEENVMEDSPPKDMQTSIRALKYALNHELVYRDHAVELNRVQKAVEPYQKLEMPPRPRLKTTVEKIDDVLVNLKSRTTVTEASLSEVLGDKHLKENEFPEAKKLLQQIQRRYNTVRVNSMKEAKEAKKLLRDTMKDLGKVAEGLNKRSEKTKA
ncbi:hypothetical protein ScPMuIL_018221 [Solemya velum]